MEHIWWDRTGKTPLGTVWLAACDEGLLAVQVGGPGPAFCESLTTRYGLPLTRCEDRVQPMIQQIEAYLLGQQKTFEFSIHWGNMSAFQQKVLRAVLAIPYGQRRSYGQIAAQIGVPKAPRAVGRANATNPMPLVIPCHRLVGADGSLRGYGGAEGIKTKAWLLDLEQKQAGSANETSITPEIDVLKLEK